MDSQYPHSFVVATETMGVSTIIRLGRLSKLDLHKVFMQLIKPTEEGGLAWNERQTMEVEKWYKRYLATVIAYPDGKHIPNTLIRKFWHYHILDTMAYAVDCEYILGYFLHHSFVVDEKRYIEESNAIQQHMFGVDSTKIRFFKIDDYDEFLQNSEDALLDLHSSFITSSHYINWMKQSGLVKNMFDWFPDLD